MSDFAAIDFGTHKLGTWTVRFPCAALAAVVVLTLLCLWAVVLLLRFDGEPSTIFAGNHPEYLALQDIEKRFHRFSKDEILIVESDALTTVEGIELLREMHFDLQLLEGTALVSSIFSIAEYNADENSWSTLLPAEFEGTIDVREVLGALHSNNKIAQSLISEDLNTAVIIYSPTGAGEENQQFQETSLQEVIELYREEGFSITQAGANALEREIIQTVQQDSILLAVLGVGIATAIAFFLFRSWRSIVICLTPLLLSSIFYLGAISAVGLPIDLLTIIIPVLVMVLAFADSIHLYLRWQRIRERGADNVTALYQAVEHVGPAVFLAALTTAVAFVILMITSNNLLDRLAVSGLIGMASIYIGVIVAVPLAIYWIPQGREDKIDKPSQVLGVAGHWANKLVERQKGRLFYLSLIAVLPMIFIHFTLPTQYSLLDYLSENSNIRNAEFKMEALFGGTDQLIVTLKRQSDSAVVSEDEVNQLLKLERVVEGEMTASNAFSIATVLGLEDGDTANLDFDFETGQNPFATVLSHDRSLFAVSIPVSNSVNAADFNSKLEMLAQKIKDTFPDLEFAINGSAKVQSAIAPQLIDNLRIGLLISVIVSTILLALVFKSWIVGLISLLPNLLPILIAETFVWVFASSIDFTVIIALMIGYGLAIDDTVHFLNQYFKSQKSGEAMQARITSTLQTIGPAIVATTLILGVGLSGTIAATTPTVSTFGIVVIVILIFALIADLIVLPSALFVFDRAGKRQNDK